MSSKLGRVLHAVTLAVVTAAASAQPYQLADLGVGVATYASSWPTLLAPAGDRAVLGASSSLWGSNGTLAGTERLFPDCGASCPLLISRGWAFQVGLGFSVAPFLEGEDASLWRTDGTAAGTWRLMSLVDTLASDIFLVAATGGGERLFLSAPTEQGFPLLVTDGSIAGTGILPGVTLRPNGMGAALGGIAYFAAFDDRGWELWQSDATAQGTLRVTDLQPGEASFSPVYLTALGSRLLLFGADPLRGRELFVSDGTAPGTQFVAELTPGPGSTVVSVGPRVGQGGRLAYFVATPADHSEPELWRSDGTAAGTVRLTHFANATALAGSRKFVSLVGDELFFLANDGVHGSELWHSLGTPESTRMVADLCPGPCHGITEAVGASLGGELYFRADDGVHGSELWQTVGNATAVRLVRDLCPGPCPSHPSFAEGSAGFLWLFATAKVNGPTTLWRLPPNAPPVRLTRPNVRVDLQGRQQYLPSRLLFRATGPEGGSELWASDGTRPGTGLLADLAPAVTARGSNPKPFVPDGDGAQFVAVGEGGVGWYRSDGTASGTRRLAKLLEHGESDRWLSPILLTTGDNTSFLSLRPEHPDREPWPVYARRQGEGARLAAEVPDLRQEFLATLGSRLLFVSGDQAWSSDGTRPGTTALSPSVATSYQARFVVFGSRALFHAEGNSPFGTQAMLTDGTPAGTRPLASPEGVITTAECTAAVGDRLVFASRTPDATYELWATDGTVDGTLRLGPQGFSQACRQGRTWTTDTRAFFLDGCEVLWATDGTAAGTTEILPWGDPRCGNLRPLASSRTHLFARRRTPGGGEEIVALDGQPAGIVTVAELSPSDSAGATAQLGSDLLFLASGPAANGRAVWRSDGTRAGTVLILAPAAGAYVSRLRAFDQKALITGTGPDGQAAAWETDGTPGGTLPLPRLVAQALAHQLGDVTIVDGLLYFPGDEPATGKEPWAYRLAGSD